MLHNRPIFQHQPMSGWLNRLRLHYHIWMFIMQLGQPQPELSNHSLAAVGQVVDIKPIRFNMQEFNVRPKNLQISIKK